MSQSSIKSPIVDGLHDLFGRDVVGILDVGNGSSNSQHFVVRPGRQAQLIHRLQQRLLTEFIELTMFAQRLATDAAIRHGRLIAVALPLSLSRSLNLLSHGGRPRPILDAAKLRERHARHFDMNVDSINQWPTDPRQISLNLNRCALATASGVSQVAAGAFVRCLFTISLEGEMGGGM